VHDLQWGLLDDFSSQEASQQQGCEPFAMKFDDQGVGVDNPDFEFPVGFGFAISKSFILNGDIVLRGRVQYMQWTDTTAGVCTVRAAGLGPNRLVRDVRFSHGKHGAFVLGDYVEAFAIEGNTIWGGISLAAPTRADGIAIEGNEIRGFSGAGVRLEGAGVKGVRVVNNRVSEGGGDGILCQSAGNAVVSGNVVQGLTGGTGIKLDGAGLLVLQGNMVTGNGAGIRVTGSAASAGTVTGNASRGNQTDDWACETPGGLALSGNTWE
jgi:hypothetical protein